MLLLSFKLKGPLISSGVELTCVEQKWEKIEEEQGEKRIERGRN